MIINWKKKGKCYKREYRYRKFSLGNSLERLKYYYFTQLTLKQRKFVKNIGYVCISFVWGFMPIWTQFQQSLGGWCIDQPSWIINQYYQLLYKWPTTNPTWFLLRDKWPSDSMSEINCHRVITPPPRIEPVTLGLLIQCSPNWTNWTDLFFLIINWPSHWQWPGTKVNHKQYNDIRFTDYIFLSVREINEVKWEIIFETRQKNCKLSIQILNIPTWGAYFIIK